MKPIKNILVYFLGAASALAGNAGSVIKALQTIADQPYAQNASFVEVKGERGSPNPQEWTILLSDPTARGGVREVTIANGQITSERTPLRGFTDVANVPALSRSKVVADVGPVFQAVEQESIAKKVGFDWIDYNLKSDTASDTPLWKLKLYDSLGSLVATATVSATNGKLMGPLELAGDAATENNSKRPGGLVGKIIDFSETTARKTQETTLRTIGNVQEFMVGERTVGPKKDD
jgi:hypothetical protein